MRNPDLSKKVVFLILGLLSSWTVVSAEDSPPLKTEEKDDVGLLLLAGSMVADRKVNPGLSKTIDGLPFNRNPYREKKLEMVERVFPGGSESLRESAESTTQWVTGLAAGGMTRIALQGVVVASASNPLSLLVGATVGMAAKYALQTNTLGIADLIEKWLAEAFARFLEVDVEPQPKLDEPKLRLDDILAQARQNAGEMRQEAAPSTAMARQGLGQTRAASQAFHDENSALRADLDNKQLMALSQLAGDLTAAALHGSGHTGPNPFMGQNQGQALDGAGSTYIPVNLGYPPRDRNARHHWEVARNYQNGGQQFKQKHNQDEARRMVIYHLQVARAIDRTPPGPMPPRAAPPRFIPE